MLQKSSMSRTMEPFFANPTKKEYLMDISRNIRLAHTSVKKNLDKLVKSGLIVESIEKRGGRKFPLYNANLDSKTFKKYKILDNLSLIFESRLVNFIEEKLAPKSVVLFGSYQRGEDTNDSDVDIFLECKKEEIDISSFEKRIGRKIQLHFNERFNTYPKELKNNIINGTVLSGFLEAYK